MKKKEITKRYILFIVSLFFCSYGCCCHKAWRTRCITNFFCCQYYQLQIYIPFPWNVLIIWNCVLILGQILILRKDFKLIQLLQIPLSFVFGYFTDFGMWCVSFIPANSYIIRLILVICGIIILGFGISLSVIANVIMNSGEAFVKAMSDKSKQNFSNVKIGFDVLCVILSIILSLLFFSGNIVGTREGTIISAFLTGIVVKFFTRILDKPFTTILQK